MKSSDFIDPISFLLVQQFGQKMQEPQPTNLFKVYQNLTVLNVENVWLFSFSILSAFDTQTETDMRAHRDRLMQRYHTDTVAFPCDRTSITEQNHSRNISLNICILSSHACTNTHKHSESLLLSMMKQTPRLRSRNLQNPSDSPLLRPQGEWTAF